MLSTIQLNNEFGFLTKEIREILSNRMLAAELEVAELIVAQA